MCLRTRSGHRPPDLINAKIVSMWMAAETSLNTGKEAAGGGSLWPRGVEERSLSGSSPRSFPPRSSFTVGQWKGNVRGNERVFSASRRLTRLFQFLFPPLTQKHNVPLHQQVVCRRGFVLVSWLAACVCSCERDLSSPCSCFQLSFALVYTPSSLFYLHREIKEEHTVTN